MNSYKRLYIHNACLGVVTLPRTGFAMCGHNNGGRRAGHCGLLQRVRIPLTTSSGRSRMRGGVTHVVYRQRGFPRGQRASRPTANIPSLRAGDR
eukprot:8596669-Pyramimonas_sp.AAC.2